MSDEAVIPLRQLRQVGWRSVMTGNFCTCPPYEVAPHANWQPLWVIDGAPLSEGDDLRREAIEDSLAEERREFERRMP